MLISNEHLGMKAQEWFTDFSFDKIALAGTEREMRDTRANPAKRYWLEEKNWGERPVVPEFWVLVASFATGVGPWTPGTSHSSQRTA
jgi:hypothetical protein